jgi:hypothetical protein
VPMSLLSVPIEMRMWHSLSQFIPKMSKEPLPDLNGSHGDYGSSPPNQEIFAGERCSENA